METSQNLTIFMVSISFYKRKTDKSCLEFEVQGITFGHQFNIFINLSHLFETKNIHIFGAPPRHNPKAVFQKP